MIIVKSLTSILLLFLIPSIAQSQVFPSQTITLTTGNRGTFQSNQSTTDRAVQQTFNFTFSSQEKTLNDQIRSNQRGRRQRQRDLSQINTSSFSLEKGQKRTIESVQSFDSYDFLQSSFSQNLSIEY